MGVEVAVVFHSANQLTRVQAAAVLKGVGKVKGARAQLLSVNELAEGSYGWTALDKADAIVFGAPTYLGAVPAAFRRLTEPNIRRPRWKDKLAAGFTCAGSLGADGRNGLRQLASIAGRHGMRWVDPDRIDDDPAAAEDLGLRIAEAALRSKGELPVAV